jgi:guanylate kinase
MGKSMNDRIIEREEDFLDTIELFLDNETTSLDGIERLTKLDSLRIQPYEPDFDYSILDSEYLKDNIKQITVIYDKGNTCLSFLKDYKKLEKIVLYNCEKISDFSVLDSKPLQETIKEINLAGINALQDLSFLRDYNVLEKIELSDCESISDFSALASESLQNTVKVIIIRNNKLLTTLTDIKNYTHLEELVLVNCPSLKDFSGLVSNSLQKTTNQIGLHDIPNLVELSFLKDYKMLHKISISSCANLKDFSALSSESLQNKVGDYYLDGNINLIELSFIGKYKSLDRILVQNCPNLSDFSVFESDFLKRTLRDIYFQNVGTMNDITFLRTYMKLETINLPQTVNWNKNDGKRFINTETVNELIRRGVNVKQPSNFPFNEEMESEPTLYLICGPSASGKSTIIDYMIDTLGVKQLRKTTSRDLRLGEEKKSHAIVKASLADIQQYSKQGKFLFEHDYMSHKYGINILDFYDAYLSKDKYLFDTCDIESAYKLRKAYPGFVKVIAIIPHPDLLEKGLITRNSVDTIQRLRRLPELFNQMLAYATDADYRIIGSDWEENRRQIKEIITGK